MLIRSAAEIADKIDRLRSYYVAASFGLVLLNDDDVLQLIERKGYDLGSRVTLGRRDNTYHETLPDLWTAIGNVRESSAFNLDFLGSLLMGAVSWVGDDLKNNGYFDKTPELEFFRHLRNAISHGNRWHFTHQEPRRPASFGAFTLTKDLHDQEGVLFEFMSTGDVADLLEHTAAYLRTGPPQM